MELPQLAQSLTDSRSQVASWGKAVRDLRNDPEVFTADEIETIEREYAEKTELERDATEQLQQHIDKATHETAALETRVRAREIFMTQHESILSASPGLWSQMQEETENFKAVIESIKTLLGSAK